MGIQKKSNYYFFLKRKVTCVKQRCYSEYTHRFLLPPSQWDTLNGVTTLCLQQQLCTCTCTYIDRTCAMCRVGGTVRCMRLSVAPPQCPPTGSPRLTCTCGSDVHMCCQKDQLHDDKISLFICYCWCNLSPPICVFFFSSIRFSKFSQSPSPHHLSLYLHRRTRRPLLHCLHNSNGVCHFLSENYPIPLLVSNHLKRVPLLLFEGRVRKTAQCLQCNVYQKVGPLTAQRSRKNKHVRGQAVKRATPGGQCINVQCLFVHCTTVCRHVSTSDRRVAYKTTHKGAVNSSEIQPLHCCYHPAYTHLHSRNAISDLVVRPVSPRAMYTYTRISPNVERVRMYAPVAAVCQNG